MLYHCKQIILYSRLILSTLPWMSLFKDFRLTMIPCKEAHADPFDTPFFQDNWQVSDPVAESYFSKRSPMYSRELMKPIAPLLSSDVVESSDAFTILVDLPGVDPADIEVTIENNVLVMKAERKERVELKGQVHSLERSYGNALRRIPLPKNADLSQVRSSFKNGELIVTFPKISVEQPSCAKIQISAK